MTSKRDGLKEDRQSFENAQQKAALNHVAEEHERHSETLEHAKHKDARYDNEAFESEKKEYEG
ncbi:hypothetical protein H7198_03570 [Fructobacillus sp. CRL 2054]|uniref:hypothetical protein n=1 Tax=Fructobacillus sp. CRL 2054 TaxID=2763007 RepID=UPI0023787733|nr:hypothetical protein [Fructobacillus sp. CRL 2054]MDD9138680.1 hypothetical protein [Fructobacillus sp. CRL 2054]